VAPVTDDYEVENLLLCLALGLVGSAAYTFANRSASAATGPSTSEPIVPKDGDTYAPPPQPDSYVQPTNGPPPPGVTMWTGPVPAELTAFAKEVLMGPYPMHSSVTRTFSSYPQPVMALVCWHTWTTRNGQVIQRPEGIRGVTLFRVSG